MDCLLSPEMLRLVAVVTVFFGMLSFVYAEGDVAATDDGSMRAMEVNEKESVLRQEKYLKAEECYAEMLKNMEMDSYDMAAAKLANAKEALGKAVQEAQKGSPMVVKYQELRLKLRAAELDLHEQQCRYLLNEAKRANKQSKLDEADKCLAEAVSCLT